MALTPADQPRRVDLRLMLTQPAVASWSGVDVIAEAIGTDNWTLAGGQMVMVHLAPHRDTGHRATADADLAVDVRAGKRAIMEKIATVLTEADFDAQFSPEGVTKFIRGEGRIDLLAPDGFNAKAVTVGGGHAIEAPGTTQALGRSELVEVQWSDRSTVVQCPTIFAALVAKAAAATGTNEGAARRQRHLDDVVALASVIAETGPGPEKSTKKDRQRIAAALELLTADNSAWTVASNQRDVRTILSMLSSPG